MSSHNTPKSTPADSTAGRTDIKSSQFVPVAIPKTAGESEELKAQLEEHEIPTLLEGEAASDPTCPQPAAPAVLVPEHFFEQASEMVMSYSIRTSGGEEYELDDDFDDVDEELDDGDLDDQWDDEEDEDEEYETDDEEDDELDEDFEDEEDVDDEDLFFDEDEMEL